MALLGMYAAPSERGAGIRVGVVGVAVASPGTDVVGDVLRRLLGDSAID